MQFLLGDFNAKVGREDILKQTIWNESLHENSSYNGAAVVSCATSKNVCQEHNVTTLKHL
jgi:hypothetical protein